MVRGMSLILEIPLDPDGGIIRCTYILNVPEGKLDLAKCNLVATSCAGIHRLRASRVVWQVYRKELRSSGLLPTQFSMVIAMALLGPVSISNLAEVLVMDRTTLSRNLKPLERQRPIGIEPGEDQRQRILPLTEQGEERLAHALPLWEQAQARVVKRLGEERYINLLAELSATVELMRTEQFFERNMYLHLIPANNVKSKFCLYKCNDTG